MDPDSAGRVPTRSDFLRQNPGCTNRNFVTLTTSEQLTLSPPGTATTGWPLSLPAETVHEKYTLREGKRNIWVCAVSHT